MKALFTTWAWPSHFYPLVPVARALAADGVDVRVVTAPDHLATVEGTGLIGVPAGRPVDFHSLLKGALELDPEQSSATTRVAMDYGKLLHAVEVFVEVADAMLPETIEFAESWQPDLVVYDLMSYAGPVLANLRGIPSVRHLWGPDLPGHFRQVMGRGVGGPVRDLFARYGFDTDDVWGTLTLDNCPPSLQVDTPYPAQHMRYVPYYASAGESAWYGMRTSRPLVCVTGGTTDPVLGAHVFGVPQQIAAIAELDVDVVVAVSRADGALLTGLPANVRVVHDVPLHRILADADVLVSHGGTGTVLTGVAAGVPQLITPSLPDHAFNAERLAGAGAGLVLDWEDMDRDTICRMVTDLLPRDGRYAAAARRLKAENDALPAPAEVVRPLRTLAQLFDPATAERA
ncbi:nucleotide disphospho-sugar-binding domain-containing protein [Actinoplanes sp. NPDC048791]|uniref:nucleotide disphospho-sugar-binding domain-containing protein n=1 Tax=Actinoplanes sp. NPDC048791 TaxID=3154623 RepID=UPI003409A572